MYMRIVWGKIKEGAWDQYEEAYRKAVAASPGVPGRKGRWLSRDTNDPDAGFAITLWENKDAMDEYYGTGKKYQKDIYPLIEPYFINQYTTTICEVRVTDEASPESGDSQQPTDKPEKVGNVIANEDKDEAKDWPD